MKEMLHQLVLQPLARHFFFFFFVLYTTNKNSVVMSDIPAEGTTVSIVVIFPNLFVPPFLSFFFFLLDL